jgi:hypothetical protein
VTRAAGARISSLFDARSMPGRVRRPELFLATRAERRAGVVGQHAAARRRGFPANCSRTVAMRSGRPHRLHVSPARAAGSVESTRGAPGASHGVISAAIQRRLRPVGSALPRRQCRDVSCRGRRKRTGGSCCARKRLGRRGARRPPILGAAAALHLLVIRPICTGFCGVLCRFVRRGAVRIWD